ncbi:MAG: serine/threonine-protein kinase [Verrucomicrobiota bacterium]
MPPPTPSDDTLRALLAGSLPPDEESRLESLLQESPELRARLDQLSGATDFDQHFNTDPPQSDHPASPIHHRDTNIGPYQILSQIAAGGMGIVYQAHDPALNRTVAIKLLAPTLAANPEAKQRFLREAHAAAAVEHPNIVPIYAVEKDADPPYIVMRYIEGQTLQQLLDETPGQPLPLNEITPISLAIANALAAAHQNKSAAGATGSSGTLALVHRDIKPSNILLEDHLASAAPTPESSSEHPVSSIYLTDFGLARTLEADTALTRTGTFLGTPQYMSPEQAAGSQNLDPRSDLFSFGAVLYTMATGQPPFDADNFATLSDQIREQPPTPPRKLNPKLPPWLANLITRLLAKDPNDRPQSAKEVAQTISAQSDLGTVSLRLLLGKTTRARKRLIHTALATLAVLTLGAAFVALEKTGRTHVVNTALAALTGDPFTIETRWGTHPTLDDTIKAAQSHDVIVLRTNETIPGVNLTIPTGKALTLRAAEGSQPTLASSDPAIPLITAHSPLRLEHLTLRQDLPTDGPPPPAMIRIEDASGTIDHCHLERTPLTRDPTYPAPSERAVVSVKNAPLLEITHSRIIAPGSTGIGVNSFGAGNPSVVRLDHNWIRAAKNVFHNQRDARARMEARNNFVHGGSFLEYRGDGSRLGYELESNNNLFYLDRCFIDHPGAKESRIRSYYSWDAAENIYITKGPLILAGYRTPIPEERFFVAYLTELRKFFRRQDLETDTVFTLLPEDNFPTFPGTLVSPDQLLDATYTSRNRTNPRNPTKPTLPVGPNPNHIGPASHPSSH